jgi:hypothetical protein
MKTRIYIIILISSLLVFSCEKEKYESAGTITGADLSMCACCGGYFITIDGAKYRFDKLQLPDNFTFNDNQLPLKVELNWKLNNELCSGLNWIAISKIREIK